MKIVGDYHTHTEYSDGHGTVEDNIKAAKAAGLSEIAVTDHGHGKINNGIKPKDYSRVKALIEKAARENDIKAYFGVEANVIGTDGQIDVKAADRAGMDILLLGIHRFVKPCNLKSFLGWWIPNIIWWMLHIWPKGRIRKNTEVMKRAIEKNNIDIWTHPRRYFKLDVLEVAKSCIERGTLIELSGKHISFRPIDFERMLAMGAKFVINSDAHFPNYVGSVDRAYEFLKYCDFNESDIINLTGTFRRADAPILKAAKKAAEEVAEKKPVGRGAEISKKDMQKLKKEQKRIKKTMKRKR